MARKKTPARKKKASAAKRPAKKPARKKAPSRKAAPKRKAAARKKTTRKTPTRRAARKPVPRATRPIDERELEERGADFGLGEPIDDRGLGPESGGQSGDTEGLSRREIAASESVEELLEEGQAFEAGVISGVENAPDADEGEVTTREVPEDDVPQEYLDRD